MKPVPADETALGRPKEVFVVAVLAVIGGLALWAVAEVFCARLARSAPVEDNTDAFRVRTRAALARARARWDLGREAAGR